MKKYNTPEIEALALETIDVIATSGGADTPKTAADMLSEKGYTSTGDIGELNSTWSW